MDLKTCLIIQDLMCDFITLGFPYFFLPLVYFGYLTYFSSKTIRECFVHRKLEGQYHKCFRRFGCLLRRVLVENFSPFNKHFCLESKEEIDLISRLSHDPLTVCNY